MSQITPPLPTPPPIGEATGTAASATTPQATPQQPAAPSFPRAPPPPTPESNQRLTIQESGELGVFVYTIVDRTTGQVIAQLPREDVAELSRHPAYAAGQVIKTTV